MVPIEDEIINQMQEPSKVETALTAPSVDAFKNFLSLAIADKTFGGAMDPTEGSSWRSGELKNKLRKKLEPLNLKNLVLESGGRSKESYSEELGRRGFDVSTEDVAIDTLSYQDRGNFNFNIGTEDDPNMMKSESTIEILGGNVGSGMQEVVNQYIESYMGRESELKGESSAEGFWSKMDSKDPRRQEYKDMRKFIFDVVDEGGVESALEQFPFLGEAYTKYSEAFGSK